ncbi:hypothetical protein OUZ56_025224 [Daphnia magna]|uniref:Ionotropic glutamate receptor C-terminal domain-containing protein n=1 Tax=Daphnia magna TaxID=35525 RepID=A0ABQ9ZJ68_9CRUS|nr:hypothetical protein OUZ56_025224 [Daphnia magna]
MWDNGLMNLWESWFRAIPVNRSPTRVKTSPLSLKNLAGAFVVLSVGYGLSLLVFVVEHIMGYANRQRDRKRRNNF